MNLCDLLSRSARCFRTSWEILQLRTDQEERAERVERESRPAEPATGEPEIANHSSLADWQRLPDVRELWPLISQA